MKGIVTTATVNAPELLTSYSTVMTDVLAGRYLVMLDSSNLSRIAITNNTASTPIQNGETPDQIRTSAPSVFRSQYRLVHEKDYETFIKSNFTNLITDVKVINNWGYTTNYLKYFHDLG